MRLSMKLSYAGGFKEAVQQVVDLEQAGLDVVWVAEAYSFDAISQMGYLAAKTERIQIGSGIVNVYSRTPALMAMTFAGLDYVSDGRIICGLGASGPQVVEGFHGVPYEKPMKRIKEYIEVCRMVWRRERLVYDGETVQVPLPEGQGTGLGKPLKLINHPVRTDIPIWWASLMGKSVEATAELADGWLPIMFIPEQAPTSCGATSLTAGLAKRSPDLAPLEICAGGIAGHRRGPRRRQGRPHPRRRPPGDGAVRRWHGRPGQELLQRRGPALRLRRRGHRDPGPLPRRARRTRPRPTVPAEWLEKTSLVGPASYVKERVAAFKEAGVTVLAVTPDRAGRGEDDRAAPELLPSAVTAAPRSSAARPLGAATPVRRGRAWSSRTAARQTVTRSAVGRWRYSFGAVGVAVRAEHPGDHELGVGEPLAEHAHERDRPALADRCGPASRSWPRDARSSEAPQPRARTTGRSNPGRRCPARTTPGRRRADRS